MNILGPLIFGAAALSLFAVWLFALISALKNENLDSTTKLTWVIVIVFVTGLGALIYLVVAPDRPTRETRVLADWRRRNERLQRESRGA